MATHVSSSFTQCQYVINETEDECQGEQYSLCPHCNLWLCSLHHQEHQQIVQTNAHSLNDHANKIRQDLIELSVENIRVTCKRKADEWREQMYTEIDAKYMKIIEQSNELTSEVKKFQKDKIESFTHEITEPLTNMLTKQKQIHPDTLRRFKTELDLLEQQMEKITNPNLIHLNFDDVKLNGEIHITYQRVHLMK